MLHDQLLHACFLCDMTLGGPPVYRLQLYFIARKDLESKSHQCDFQRALETGVDTHGFWKNHGARGSGEYEIARTGFKRACALFGNVETRYTPVRGDDFKCVLRGSVAGIDVKIKFIGRHCRVFLDGEACKAATDACRTIESRSELVLPTVRTSAPRTLWDMAVDQDFEFVWGT
jgi:hypothetical protein